MNKKTLVCVMVVTILAFIVTELARVNTYVPSNAKKTVAGLIEMDYP